MVSDKSSTTEHTAGAVARGVRRLFARNGIWCLAEMPLRNGRRADLMGIDPNGHIVIVEIKVTRQDLLSDNKWTDYLEFCDHFYWALAPNLDYSLLESPSYMPDQCGIIAADEYDGTFIRSAPWIRLAPARRSKETERLGRAGLRRMTCWEDPQCSQIEGAQ